MRRRTLSRHLTVGIVTATAVALTAAALASAVRQPPATAACRLPDGFGRLLPALPSARWELSDLAKLADAIDAPEQIEPPAGSGLQLEMPGTPAGYTYIGQFVDHDITRDARTNDLLSTVDIATLTNGRTPQLDLDSLYGKGPAASPEFYEADHLHLRLGAPLTGAASDPRARDLVRDPASGRAVIGDDRDDENRMVASFHGLVARFHNAVVDDVRRAHADWAAAKQFAEARRTVTWYYQWALLTDLLPRLVDLSTLDAVVNRKDSRWTTALRFFDPCKTAMPVEFTGAAYRFGHSMVRDDYQLNATVKMLPVFDLSRDPRASVGGFQPSPPDFAVDWDYFVAANSAVTPQEAYKLDNSIVPALRKLPGPAAGTASTILATRNLLRGQQLGLPTGQDVARAMDLPVLTDDQLVIGPALGVGAHTPPITDISPAFAGRAPLWTYILAESVHQSYVVENATITAVRREHLSLGPVGSRIVAETFVGLLASDPGSMLNHPEFEPVEPYRVRFTFADLIGKATGRTTRAL